MCSGGRRSKTDSQGVRKTDLAILMADSGLHILALIFLLLLLGHSAIMSPTQARAYRVTIVLTITVMLTEVSCAVLDMAAPGLWRANAAANAVGFAMAGGLPYILAVAYDERLLRRHWLLAAAPMLLAVLCLLSCRTGWVFSVSPDNAYARGPLFWIYLLVEAGGLALLAAANIHQSRRYFLREKVFLLLLYLFFLLGISLQILCPALHTSWQCVTLVLLLYYIFQRELQFRYDTLTGVLNRASFVHVTEMPPEAGGLLVVFDLDDFKSINDTYGHQVGDDCLCVAADILRRSFSSIGRCYRIGGDEFAVVGRGDETALRSAVAAMLAQILALRCDRRPLPNISYGYAFAAPGEDYAVLFQRADRQMYSFKRSQSDRIRREPAPQE